MSRSDNQPPPTGDGLECVEKLNDTQPCNEDPCQQCVIAGVVYDQYEMVYEDECQYRFVKMVSSIRH